MLSNEELVAAFRPDTGQSVAHVAGLRRVEAAVLGRILADIGPTVKDALEGDSNDAEHDALYDVATSLGIEFEPQD